MKYTMVCVGVIEGLQITNKKFTLNAQTIPQLCGQFAKIDTCVHTTGHLLLIETSGDVAKAIAECNKLQPKYLYECFAGVFMEDLYRRNLHMHDIGTPLVWNEATYEVQKALCNKQEPLAAQACWRELSHMIVTLEKNTHADIYARCKTAPTERMHQECYLHAVSVLLLTSAPDPKSAAKLCEPVEDQLVASQCKNIAATTHATHDH